MDDPKVFKDSPRVFGCASVGKIIIVPTFNPDLMQQIVNASSLSTLSAFSQLEQHKTFKRTSAWFSVTSRCFLIEVKRRE